MGWESGVTPSSLPLGHDQGLSGEGVGAAGMVAVTAALSPSPEKDHLSPGTDQERGPAPRLVQFAYARRSGGAADRGLTTNLGLSPRRLKGGRRSKVWEIEAVFIWDVVGPCVRALLELDRVPWEFEGIQVLPSGRKQTDAQEPVFTSAASSL